MTWHYVSLAVSTRAVQSRAFAPLGNLVQTPESYPGKVYCLDIVLCVFLVLRDNRWDEVVRPHLSAAASCQGHEIPGGLGVERRRPKDQSPRGKEKALSSSFGNPDSQPVAGTRRKVAGWGELPNGVPRFLLSILTKEGDSIQFEVTRHFRNLNKISGPLSFLYETKLFCVQYKRQYRVLNPAVPIFRFVIIWWGNEIVPYTILV